MKKEVGFTLIELLAVIVILAVIALIATPLIMGTIEKAKRNAFKDTAYGVLHAAEAYASDSNAMAIGEYHGETFTFPGDIKLKFKGTRPQYGFVTVNKDGKTDLALSNEGYCAIKTVGESEIRISKGKCDDIEFEDLTELKTILEKENASNMKTMVIGGANVKKITGTKSNANNIKNHVWFSGVLWQVVETSDKGTKLISRESLASIPFGETSDWNASWVRKWLNTDIFKTAMGPNFDLISNGNFCLDAHFSNVTREAFQIGSETRKKITSFIPHTTCTNISTDKVGLMTFEDYVYALDGTVNGSVGGSFLDKDELEWTLTPGEDNNEVWHTYYYEPSHLEKGWNTTKEYGKGVRPVIYLKNNTFITSGTGTKADPFQVFGDTKGKAGEKINEQNAGEYIYLTEKHPYTGSTEKKTYQIIKVEKNGTTKIQRSSMLSNLPSSISSNGSYNMQYYSDKRDASNTNWCAYTGGTYYKGSCATHNYFRPTDGTGAFEKDKGMNIGYFLNNATNSFKSWLQHPEVLTSYQFELPVFRYNADYSIAFDRSKDIVGQAAYDDNTYDGTVNAYVGLPQAGEFLSGNDINANYWYINRMEKSSSRGSGINDGGPSDAYPVSDKSQAVRPVLHIKENVTIKSGDGTKAKPYIIE